MPNFRPSSSRRRSRFRGRKTRVCPFCADRVQIDYKDVGLISRYITGGGKIASRHKTKACSKHQRRLSEAIKRARFLALVPYAPSHIWQTGWTASHGLMPRPAPAPAPQSAPPAAAPQAAPAS
jgi:small subunit ribosomal protein S18